MSVFNTPDISGGVSDLWHYVRADRPHRWPALGLALTIALLVLYFVARSAAPPQVPQRTIIYVESWRADRSDFDVRRDWLVRARVANDRNERRRNAYGAMARVLGQDYDEVAAHNEFDDARAVFDRAMRDLEAAQAAGRPLPPLPRRQPPNSQAPAAPAPLPKTR